MRLFLVCIGSLEYITKATSSGQAAVEAMEHLKQPTGKVTVTRLYLQPAP